MEDRLRNPGWIRRRLQELGDEPLVGAEPLPEALQVELVPAGVLVPLTEIDGEMHALFTKRPEAMKRHPGEVSFPGGRAEEDDRDLVHTALREAREEVAIAEEDVEVFGALVQMPTVTGFDITTFVGEYPQPYELVADPGEVEAVFTAPLFELADPRFRRKERRRWQGVGFTVHYFDQAEHVIWGATGYMLHLLLKFLDEGT